MEEGRRALPQRGEIYRHFRGFECIVIDVAKNSEEKGPKSFVVYEDRKGGVLITPTSMFMGTAYDTENREYVYRFVKIGVKGGARG